MSTALAHLSEEIRARKGLPSPATRRALRLAAGASLRDVAVAVGVTASAVHLWETGANDPRGENLVRYAEVLRLFREVA